MESTTFDDRQFFSQRNNSGCTREACSNKLSLSQKFLNSGETSTSALEENQSHRRTPKFEEVQIVAVINIDDTAYISFLEVNQLDSCSSNEPKEAFKLEKFFIESDTVWKPALQLPFTHSVISKLVRDSDEIPIIIPVRLSSVVPRRYIENEPHSSEKSFINLYEVLSPLRDYAKSISDNADVWFSPVIFIGLHDSDLNPKAKYFFNRRIKEALSTAWTDVNIVTCRTREVRTEVKKFFYSGKSLAQLDCSAAEFSSKIISHILQESQQEEAVFITRSEIEEIASEKPKSAEQVKDAVQYLIRRGFMHPVHLTNSSPQKTSLDSYLISAKSLPDVLEEILLYSYEAKEALRRSGLVPFQVLKNNLGCRDPRQWLDVFCYFGIMICPKEIGFCSPLPSLPNNLLIPCSLAVKKVSLQIPEGYIKTETLAVRPENSHCVTECQFYLLVGLLLQRYSQASRCNYLAVRIRIDLQHIVDVCLKKSVLHASMLVKTDDDTFKSSKTAEKCSEITKLLANNGAAVLQEYGLLKGGLEIGALMKSYDTTLEFVKVFNFPFQKLTSDEGEQYVPPPSLYLWFGSYGPSETLVEKHFAILAEDINFDKVWSFLVHSRTITKLQYEKVVGGEASQRLQSSRLLSLLLKNKGDNCDQLLTEALKASNQHHLVRLMDVECSPDASLLDTKTSSGKVAQSLEMISQDTATGQIVTHDTQYHSNKLLIQSNSQVKDHKIHDASKDKHSISCFGEKSRMGILGRGLNALMSPLAANADLKTLTTPLASPGANQQGQTDPVVQPIYEARYYHAERATDHFNERPFREGGKRLGAGSYGVVYHGVLHSETGEKFGVAIKRFKKQSSLNPAHRELGRKQFRTEMNLLTRYTHENVVLLIGFSSDGPELCLIYEYMANGALSHRLDCKDNTPPLLWNIRLSIAVDIACGLHFLHCAYRQSVIHRDVKSSNVLLNADFIAKLSDFGLAVVGNEEADEVSYGPTVGTRPYMAPEAFEKVVTSKLDIYGLGMILFELATGLPPYSSKKKQNLKAYVNYIESQGIDLSKLLDPKAKWPKFKKSDRISGLQLLEIAKKCTATEYVQRQAASEVTSLIRDVANKSPSQ